MRRGMLLLKEIFSIMKPRIIKQCEEAMYDAIWLEIDRDPQRPAVARVDIKTKAGGISVW